MLRVKFDGRRVDPYLYENNTSPTLESRLTKTTNRVRVNSYFSQTSKKKDRLPVCRIRNGRPSP